MAFKSWYLNCYAGAVEPLAEDAPDEAKEFHRKLQERYQEGLTFQPLVPDDSTVDDCLYDCENQILGIMYGIDHVTSEETMAATLS